MREYAASRGLLAPSDRRHLQCDAALRAIFGVDALSFASLEAHLLRHVTPPEPIVIDHLVISAVRTGAAAAPGSDAKPQKDKPPPKSALEKMVDIEVADRFDTYETSGNAPD